MQGKHILLGVTGGIAAYKTAYLIRGLVKRGAEVKVIMTEHAKHFITPLTMATLSQNPVYTAFSDPDCGHWHSHVKLGLWADLFVIAPATANTIGKMAGGIADNLLTTTFLSAKCPTMVVPSMDVDMFAHPLLQRNLATLLQAGVDVMEPEYGALASGLLGKGRMPEPDDILTHIARCLQRPQDLLGKKVLITAGPTYEKIDPVRFIGNYSSGKMGYALAEECAQRGAQVCLVSGPVQCHAVHPAIRVVPIESAAQMYEATVQEFTTCQIAILSAAVADYTPTEQAQHKIKRETQGSLTLQLQPTRDIAATLGEQKKSNQILVGFALETEHEQAHAIAKLKRKNLDFIVLNSLRDAQACFGYDTNKVTLIDSHGNQTAFPLKPKADVAKDIVNQLLPRCTSTPL